MKKRNRNVRDAVAVSLLFLSSFSQNPAGAKLRLDGTSAGPLFPVHPYTPATAQYPIAH
jgi:hypothetical protein